MSRRIIALTCRGRVHADAWWGADVAATRFAPAPGQLLEARAAAANASAEREAVEAALKDHTQSDISWEEVVEGGSAAIEARQQAVSANSLSRQAQWRPPSLT